MAERCGALEPLYSAYLDGELDAGERARVETHLRGCAPCREGVADLGRTRAALRSVPVRRAPHTLFDEPAGHPSRAHPTRSPGVSVTAAAILGLLVGAAFALGSGNESEPPPVALPVEVYVADHLVHSVGGPVAPPVLVDTHP
jgi:anti-sigma factor RsiW